jgi:hypothetical protein
MHGDTGVHAGLTVMESSRLGRREIEDAVYPSEVEELFFGGRL